MTLNLLKLLYLWVKYLFYLFTFKECILIRNDSEDVYYINPEAVRRFRMSVNNVTFSGSINGLEVDFIVPFDKIYTITTFKEG